MFPLSKTLRRELMDYRGRFFQHNFNVLKKYLQQHLTHNYHLRPMIQYVKNQNWKDVVGVEIGTLRALNALSMFQHLNIKHLYLVDPYTIYDDGINKYQNREKDLQIAQQNMKPYKDKVTFLIKTSIDAVQDIPNNIDFVYIDGNHSYRYVQHDIEEYYPKVKSGGIIGGHDFRVDCAGLCKAVLQFVGDNYLELQGYKTDWWIVKT